MISRSRQNRRLRGFAQNVDMLEYQYMYAGVDIGGTKVLAAILNEHGQITEQARFPTPQDYQEFLETLAKTVANFSTQDYLAAGVGMPVTSYDRHEGRGLTFGNLPWRDVPIQSDLERLFHCPVAIENDAKLGALSEYMMVRDTFHKILYVTVSTGIGIGLVEDGVIDKSIGDAGGRVMYIEHDGNLVPWESVVSGRAIVERFGKKAMDITDEATWKIIAHDLSRGLIELIALCEPEAIIIGGSVGTYFKRFGSYLEVELKKFETPLVKAPQVRGAARAEEAVIYGCYDFAKQVYGNAKLT